MEGFTYELVRKEDETGPSPSYRYDTDDYMPPLPKAGRPAPGYHIADIPRGVHGEFSKIEEELAEAKDAFEQGVRLMGLVELSDMILAIKAFLAKYHPSFSIGDLFDMATVTERAFDNGHRVARDAA